MGKCEVRKLSRLRRRIAELKAKAEIGRKELEKALCDAQAMYKMLVRTSPHAVTVTDLKGKITDVSKRTANLHGYNSAREMIGKSAFDMSAPEDHKRAMENLRKVLKRDVIVCT